VNTDLDEELTKAFKEIYQTMTSIWDEIKECFKNEYIDIIKVSWPCQSLIKLKSQVMNRKPMLARARSTC
jgi:site-specific DNA-cytosine methylase